MCSLRLQPACRDQTNARASVTAALLRASIAVPAGYAVVWLKLDISWNFVAVALGMAAFGQFALLPPIARIGYKEQTWTNNRDVGRRCAQQYSGTFLDARSSEHRLGL
jgi:hypothetical protein